MPWQFILVAKVVKVIPSRVVEHDETHGLPCKPPKESLLQKKILFPKESLFQKNLCLQKNLSYNKNNFFRQQE